MGGVKIQPLLLSIEYPVVTAAKINYKADNAVVRYRAL